MGNALCIGTVLWLGTNASYIITYVSMYTHVLASMYTYIEKYSMERTLQIVI